jgi:hypothetical protein
LGPCALKLQKNKGKKKKMNHAQREQLLESCKQRLARVFLVAMCKYRERMVTTVPSLFPSLLSEKWVEMLNRFGKLKRRSKGVTETTLQHMINSEVTRFRNSLERFLDENTESIDCNVADEETCKSMKPSRAIDVSLCTWNKPSWWHFWDRKQPVECKLDEKKQPTALRAYCNSLPFELCHQPEFPLCEHHWTEGCVPKRSCYNTQERTAWLAHSPYYFPHEIEFD